MCAALIAGVALAIYCNYRTKAYLDKTDLIIGIVAVISGSGILLTVAYYGNRPQKKE
jgi:hypothetical protein